MADSQETQSPRPYVTDEETMAALEAWVSDDVIRPDVFIIAPSVHDVGEQQLIDDLAEASYRLAGCHDARRRHYLSRTLPFRDTQDAFYRFLDEAFLTSEITDEFIGVDNIDLSRWLGADTSTSELWPYLIRHINAHPETDFVFCAYTDEPDEAMKLEQAIVRDTGIALQTVRLGYPTPEMLVGEFDKRSKGEFSDQTSYVLVRFEKMASAGKQMNYGFAHACAVHALHLLSQEDDKGKVLEAAFGRYTDMAPMASRPSSIVGFN